MTNRTHAETMRAVNIGRAKRMFDGGLSVRDIATVLQIPESKVREYADIIETAEKNKEAEKGS